MTSTCRELQQHAADAQPSWLRRSLTALVGIAVGGMAFIFFAGIQSRAFEQAVTGRSLTLAALIVGLFAAAYAGIVRPRETLLSALLVSGPFLLFLVAALIGLRVAGDPELGPIIDAVVIFSAACVGVWIGRTLRPVRN